MKACPRCGGTSGFMRSIRIYGTVQEYSAWADDDGVSRGYRGNGEAGMYYVEPKTARCEDCGKRVPNPFLEQENET